MRIGITLAAVGAAVLAAACSGSPAPHKSRTAATPSAQPAAAVSSPPSCQSQFLAWQNGGGSANFSAFQSAMKASQKALNASMAAGDSAASLAAVSSTAAALQAAAQTMQADPPPPCVPGLQGDMGSAMAAYANAAQGEMNFVQATQAGDISTANSDSQAVVSDLDAGTKALGAATQDTSTFAGS